MSEPSVQRPQNPNAPRALGQLDPIGHLAQLERQAHLEKTTPQARRTSDIEGASLDVYPPEDRLLAPQGVVTDLIDSALGRVKLPPLLELESAISSIYENIDDYAINPDFKPVFLAVLKDESEKIKRYLALKDSS